MSDLSPGHDNGPMPPPHGYEDALNGPDVSRIIEDPGHVGFRSALAVLNDLPGPTLVPTLLRLLERAQSGDPLTSLFEAPLPENQRPILGRSLSSLRAETILNLRSAPAPHADCTGYSGLLGHVRGLVQLDALGEDDRSDYQTLIEHYLESKLDAHAGRLEALHVRAPEVFAAALAGRSEEALTRARAHDDASGTSFSVPIVARHWLLRRAFALQRSAAFIIAYRRDLVPPFMRRLISSRNVKLGGLWAWIETLATGATNCLDGFDRWLATGRSACRKGVKKLPERWVTAVVRASGARKHAASHKAQLAEALPSLRTTIAACSAKLAAHRAERVAAVREYDRLHGLPVSTDESNIHMFRVWSFGLTEAALLNIVALRFLQATERAHQVIADEAAGSRRSPGKSFSAALPTTLAAAKDAARLAEVLHIQVGGNVDGNRLAATGYAAACAFLERRRDYARAGRPLHACSAREGFERQLFRAFDPLEHQL